MPNLNRTEKQMADSALRASKTSTDRTYSDADFLSALFAGLGVFALVAGLILVAIGGWTWFAAFLQGQASGWAQFFGGIAALIAAYRIGRSQIDSDRALEAERLLTADRRSVIAVDALFEDVGVHLEALWGQVYTQRAQFIVMTEYHTERIIECAERIRAIDPFALPSAEIIVSVSQTPRALIYLHDALVKYQDLLNGSNFKELKRQDVTLANSLSLARLHVGGVRKLCSEALGK